MAQKLIRIVWSDWIDRVEGQRGEPSREDITHLLQKYLDEGWVIKAITAMYGGL